MMEDTLNGLDKEKDVFEILGVSSKEDCYTNLIAEAFNMKAHVSFRKKLCRYMSNDKFIIENEDDCEILSRCSFSIEINEETGKRSKVLPDMILISKSQKAVVVIENKIFSGEGYLQTRAYSSQTFIKALAHKHNIEPDFKIEFYYMTLLGEKADSEMFKSIKWYDFIVETCQGCEFNAPLNILMEDLYMRGCDLKQFVINDISEHETLNNLLNLQNRWIDHKAIINKYFEPIIEALNERYNGEVTYQISKPNSRNAQIVLLLGLKRWNQYDLNTYSNNIKFEKTRNIHLEFTMNLTGGNASVLLHYEPFPYYPVSKFSEKFPELVAGYERERTAFKEVVNERIENSKHWNVANTSLAFGKMSATNILKLSYSDFKSVLHEAFIEVDELMSFYIELE